MEIIKGYITKHKYAYQKKVKVYPIEHHYSNAYEPHYIKWACPVCEAVGHKVSIAKYTKKCSACGVAFKWIEESEENNEK